MHNRYVKQLRDSITPVLGILMLCMLSVRAFAAQDLPDFTGLFKQVSPAVVNISTTSKPKGRQYYGGPQEIPEIWREFFGLPMDPGPREKAQPQSLGSGFIISSDGYIVTNNHVIEGADEILVRFSDRLELQAELIGADKLSDIALLKVEAKGLPAISWGKRSELEPGQWVAAIGSPFGFDYSITKGIISAVNRNLPQESYVPFIQTDVPINPGNSGGPLLNMDGEVIGINSQIYTRSGGFMGLSFAIPVDHAENVIKQLKEKGHVSRGWLGVIVQEVNKNLAESFGLNKPKGALVAEVAAGGPAEKSGLETGDIIVEFNDREIHYSADLPVAVGNTKPGDKTDLVVVRNGREKTLKVEVGELPNDGSPARGASVQSKNRMGIVIEPLDNEYRNKLRLNENVQGLIVTDIDDGPGRSIGLRPGDVITHIDRQAVDNVNEFNGILRKLEPGKPISLRIIRRGVPNYITFTLSR
ncbi:DegQ family serine endoprotease [Endozoicomonadaceae bacterium StTr2]